MTPIKDFSENDWGFFVEMDSQSHDKRERDNYLKKLYFKINQMSIIREEEEEEENADTPICLSENQIKMKSNKITPFQVFHYSTATIVITSFAYFVFCVI
jgi:hypothetical protein